MYHVYLIEQVGSEFTKIGITQNVERRLTALQAANPNKLAVRYTVTCDTKAQAHELEALLHQCFAEQRGMCEWFAVRAEEVVRMIRWGFAIAERMDLDNINRMQAAVKKSGSRNGRVTGETDGASKLCADGRWIALCPRCDYVTTDRETEHQALQSLRGHMKAHSGEAIRESE